MKRAAIVFIVGVILGAIAGGWINASLDDLERPHGHANTSADYRH